MPAEGKSGFSPDFRLLLQAQDSQSFLKVAKEQGMVKHFRSTNGNAGRLSALCTVLSLIVVGCLATFRGVEANPTGLRYPSSTGKSLLTADYFGTQESWTNRRSLQEEDAPPFNCSLVEGNDDVCATGWCSCAAAPVEKETYVVVLEWFGIVVLVFLSALFSGLTLGLMSLDLVGLEIVIGGDPNSVEAKYARTIRPVRERGNLLLCTLLLGNVAVNAQLSILLADYTSGMVGFFASTAVIVIFGEITPQAICSRHPLYVGAHSVWLVKLFMIVLLPVSYPISKVLDFVLEEEIGAIYNSGQLNKLLDVHVQHQAIDAEQAKMMGGALDFRVKTVEDVMTPSSKVFSLSVEAVLDFNTVSQIFRSGFSRVPVYGKDKNDVVGLLLTKDLIVIDPEECVSVRSMIQFFGRAVHWLWPDSKLTEALALFKSGKAHLAMVHSVVNDVEDRDPYYKVTGLITLEDIIEEILQDEIVDETDQLVDIANDATRVSDVLVDRANFDFGRLTLLDSRHGNILAREEIDAVVAHLSSNVKVVSDMLRSGALTHASIRELVRCAVVKDLAGPEAEEHASRSHSLTKKKPVKPAVPHLKNWLLYERNVPNGHCTLILSGKVLITAGRESFTSEKGPWTVLAAECLRPVPNEYVPDFTCELLGKSVRVLQFSREAVVKATSTPFTVQVSSPRSVASSTSGYDRQLSYGSGADEPSKSPADPQNKEYQNLSRENKMRMLKGSKSG